MASEREGMETPFPKHYIIFYKEVFVMKTNKVKGFTLVELIVVIAIIGVLAVT